jgi:RNA polymerase sigma-70 factor (sigma-E family)
MRSDTGGFDEFVELRWHALLRFGFLLTGEWPAAEDLAQAALESVWRHWRRGIDHPDRYVKAAMVNQMRSRWRRSREVADGVERESASPVDHPGDHALREALWAELQALPAQMRAVIVLRVWEDLSEGETARILGCSVGSVKSQMSRGLRRLRTRPEVLDAAGRRSIVVDQPAEPVDRRLR